jgi:hypothetical protein
MGPRRGLKIDVGDAGRRPNLALVSVENPTIR